MRARACMRVHVRVCALVRACVRACVRTTLAPEVSRVFLPEFSPTNFWDGSLAVDSLIYLTAFTSPIGRLGGAEKTVRGQ